MSTDPTSQRLRLRRVEAATGVDAFAADVAAGLAAPHKHLACRYFYDDTGSDLFDRICQLPEYYLTRTEHQILTDHADSMVAELPNPVTVVELGSGTAAKTRLLLEALFRRQEQVVYMPVDISAGMLEQSSRALLQSYPGLRVDAVAAEYSGGLALMPADVPKLVLWLGSNIGNLDRAQAAAFLGDVGKRLGARDRILVGADLRKPAAILEPAYDDAQGVTAEFNLNLLDRINRQLGGHFDRAAFRHRATYDVEEGRIEMFLVSKRMQTVRIDALDLTVTLQADEAIHTENSYKWSTEELQALAHQASLRVVGQWFDPKRWFSVTMFSVDGNG